MLLPDEDEETLRLHRVEDVSRLGEKRYVPVHASLCQQVPKELLQISDVSPWPSVDLMDELIALAQAQGLSLQHLRTAPCHCQPGSQPE